MEPCCVFESCFITGILVMLSEFEFDKGSNTGESWTTRGVMTLFGIFNDRIEYYTYEYAHVTVGGGGTA
jgi:hypothetical protein